MALVANFRSAASALLQRYQWARQAGMTFGGKRDMWGVLGYPEIAGLTASDFMDRYERGGIAGRVVDVLPDGTWRGEMWLQEDKDPNNDTPFEQTWDELEQRLAIRSRFHQTDVLSRLSTYAVLLIGTADGDMEKPLPKGSPDKLLYLQPYLGSGGPANGNLRGQGQGQSFEADVTIAEYDLDTRSPRFALPLFYTLRRPNLAVEMFQRPIHWSRVIHVADGALRDDVFGRPALARIWNHLEDLDKVVGGGSEAFWIRANGGLHLNVDKDMTLNADAKQELKQLSEQAEEYQHQLTRMIRTRGVEVNQLGSDVANFQSPADVLITLIAGSVGIPKRLLVGSEQGELASSQDRENFRDLIGGRQANFAGPKIVRAFVDRLIEFGYLPKPKEYKVMWPTIEVMSETEKSTGAQGWASVNSSMQKTVFTDAEIRDRWAGLKPLTDEQKAEIEEEDAKKQEAAAAAQAAQNPEPNAKKTKGEKPKAKGFPPKGLPRAAEAADDEIVQVLEAAIENNSYEIVAEIVGLQGPRYLGGAGSGNFGHGGRPGQVGGSSGTHAAMSSIHSEFTRLKGRSGYMEVEPITEVEGGHQVSVRNYGDWQVPADEEDDGDYDWNEPTPATVKNLDAMMASFQAKHPDLKIKWQSDGEKNWISVRALKPGANGRFLGGPGSGNFGHSGRPGQVGGSSSLKGGIGQPASAYTPMFPEGRDTKEKFSDGHGHYTPERQRLHDEIIEKMLKGTEPVEHPTSVILGGAPGVGKSTIVKMNGIGSENTVLVNPDEIRNELPEYAADAQGRRPPLTAFTHEEASDISAALIKRAAKEQRNIVLDGTGDSTVEKLGGKVAVLRARGHRVEATYVTTSVAIAQARADARGKVIGRMVPPSDMQHMHRQVSKIYPEAVKQGMFDRSQLFDSSEGAPRLVASSEGKVLTIHDAVLWDAFVAKGSAR